MGDGRIWGGIATAIVVGALFAGCDPSFAVVADNSSPDGVLIGRVGKSDDGTTMHDVIESPAGSRIRVKSMYIDWWPTRLLVMSATCEVLASEAISDAFAEGGSVLIRASNDIEFRPGGHPGGETPPTATTRCADVLAGLGRPSVSDATNR